MKSINFDEGFEEYAINGDPNRVIRIRIADPNLFQRIEAAMMKTDELVAKYKGEPDAEKLTQFDAEVKTILNEAFGSDICTPAFHGSNIMTPDSNGRPIFYGFMNSLMEILKLEMKRVSDNMAAEVRPEVSKYLEPAALPDVSNLTPEQKRELMAQLI
jgi:hypothetical protein